MITITIKTDNAAFNEPDSRSSQDQEVARILSLLADRFQGGCANDGTPLLDINGNKVGQVRITGSSR